MQHSFIIIEQNMDYRVDGIIFTWYRVILKRVFHKSKEKMHKKIRTTKHKDKKLVHVQQPCGVSFYKNFFLIMIYVDDIAILKSNFDNDQIFSKFAQRYQMKPQRYQIKLF